MNLAALTGLGRPVDLRVRSNRIALGGTLAATMMWAAMQLVRSGSVALVEAAMVGAGVFLAWAVARELDPDHPSTATLAMPLALAAAIAFGPPAVGASAAALLSVRVVAGTTGARIRPLDLAVLVGAGWYVALQPGGWVLATTLGVAVLRSRATARRFLAATLVIGAIGTASLAGSLLRFEGTLGLAVSVALATVLVGLSAGPMRSVSSADDLGRHTIAPRRVDRARLVAAFAVGATALVAPSTSLAIAPVAAALLAVGMTPQYRGAESTGDVEQRRRAALAVAE